MRRVHALTTDRLVRALESADKPQSCLFFTVHKCASTFVNRLLWALTDASDYELRDLESAVWLLGDQVDTSGNYQPIFEQHYDRLFRLRGEIYAPQRKPLDFPGRERFKHIFFLRDPRDVLVSAYYSFAFSHAAPVNRKAHEAFLRHRDEMLAQGIDEYALRASHGWVLDVYEGYRRMHNSASESLFLSYEEFTGDTGAFIDRIADFLGVGVPQEKKVQLVKAASPIQSATRIHSHKRSGKSGQYLTELRPETIEALNEIFADVLSYWGNGVWLNNSGSR
jgi:hypothetical protein